jgi:germination protein M
MRYMKRSSRVFLLLTFMMAAFLALAACDDNGDDSADEIDETPTEAPADDPPTPEPVETPADVPDATDDEDAAEDEPTATPVPEDDPTPAPPEEDDDQATEDDQEQEASAPSEVLVYLVRGEEIGVASRAIAGVPEVATGALNELMTGVTPYEHDLGLSTAIPEGARLLDVALQDDGTLIVDVSGEFEAGGGSFSMQMRVAQVVFTATQFDTIDRVQLRVEGQDVEAIGGEGLMVDQPLTRDDFEDMSPAILIESPTPGQEVRSPIQLSGTSNTFEANMQIEIFDAAGNELYRDFATATSGTGTRGTFDLSIDLDIQTEGLGTIVMFESSAQDGSRINIVEIPVDFRQ